MILNAVLAGLLAVSVILILLILNKNRQITRQLALMAENFQKGNLNSPPVPEA